MFSILRRETCAKFATCISQVNNIQIYFYEIFSRFYKNSVSKFPTFNKHFNKFLKDLHLFQHTLFYYHRQDNNYRK